MPFLTITEWIRRYRYAYANWVSVLTHVLIGKKMSIRVRNTGDVIRNVSPQDASGLSHLLLNPNITLDANSMKELNEGNINFVWNKRHFRIKISGNWYDGQTFEHGLGEFRGDDFAVSFEWHDTPLQLKLFKKDNNKRNGDIFGVFLRESYKFLECKGETVIDVGANIADSAIYFALTGAKEVIALEPHPYSYGLAADNIKTNNLTEKIILLNAGYGKDGTMEVDGDEYGNVFLKERNGGEKIDIYSLKGILDKFGLYQYDLILKMDCEGCEYHLLEEGDVLRSFLKIQLEYHNGYRTLLKKLLTEGFRCKVMGTWKFGYLYAERINRNSM